MLSARHGKRGEQDEIILREGGRLRRTDCLVLLFKNILFSPPRAEALK